MYAENLDQAHVDSLHISSVAVNSCEHRLVDSVGFLLSFIDKSQSTIITKGIDEI